MSVYIVIASTPSGSAGLVAAPASSPSPTTSSAVVGTTAPARVIVVDDPTDPWAVIGVITGSVVGIVSAALAWQAVKIGRQANAAAIKAAEEAVRANEQASKARAAVAMERRRTFELGVLYDLAKVIDQTPVAADAANCGRSLGKYFGQLQIVPDGMLPRWWELWNCFSIADAADAVGVPLADAELSVPGTPDTVATAELVGAVQQALRDDVAEAIHAIKDEKDD